MEITAKELQEKMEEAKKTDMENFKKEFSEMEKKYNCTILCTAIFEEGKGMSFLKKIIHL